MKKPKKKIPTKSKKKAAKKAPARTKTKRRVAKKAVSKASHLRQSKTEDFVKRLQGDNSMVEYFSRLKILNPPATKFMSSENETRREGSFVRLAHANEEFTAPVLTKGKAFNAAQKDAANRRKKPSSNDEE